jgi:hypothetical protein
MGDGARNLFSRGSGMGLAEPDISDIRGMIPHFDSLSLRLSDFRLSFPA